MVTPLPCELTIVQDVYNFYQSQLWIKIERSFGQIIHCWGILRKPLCIAIGKVPALTLFLMSLSNFCIDANIS